MRGRAARGTTPLMTNPRPDTLRKKHASAITVGMGSSKAVAGMSTPPRRPPVVLGSAAASLLRHNPGKSSGTIHPPLHGRQEGIRVDTTRRRGPRLGSADAALQLATGLWSPLQSAHVARTAGRSTVRAPELQRMFRAAQ